MNEDLLKYLDNKERKHEIYKPLPEVDIQNISEINQIYDIFQHLYNIINNKSYKYYFTQIMKLDKEAYGGLILLNYIYLYNIDTEFKNNLIKIFDKYKLDNNYDFFTIKNTINNIKDYKDYILIDKNEYINLIKILLEYNEINTNELTMDNINILKSKHSGIMELIKDALCYLYKKKY